MTPLNMPCLSDFGGAVFPYTAFGGFPVTRIPGTDIAINEYMNSTCKGFRYYVLLSLVFSSL